MSDLGLGSWPARRARISGPGIALRQGDRSVGYDELADRVDELAGALSILGVQKGTRVAYLGVNDIAEFEVLFAAGRLGAVFVPLNYRLAASEIDYLLGDCCPTVLFHGAEAAELVAALTPVPGLTVLHAGQILPGGAWAGADVGLSDDAVILYTSGTTGRPKGAVLTHGNLTFNTMNQLAHVDVLSTDIALCISPLFHATGLGQVSLPTLFKGGTVVVVPKFEAAAVLVAIESQGVTAFSAVPTTLQMLCEHPRFAATDLSSLRYVIYGGSMVAQRVALAWQHRGVQILQGYGMTEASPGVCMAVGHGATERPLSIGVPHFFTDVRLDPLPGGGSTGELLVRGPNVFRGYWGRPADTEHALTDGWFRSGDVVSMGDDGWAHVVDRIKDVIISGGENIYPAEVEAALDALPGIVESAVIAHADARWGEVGMAFVVAEPGRWEQETLRQALVGRLGTFKIPKLVTFVDRLPRTATGKVRKQVLRQLGSGVLSTSSPRTEGDN